MDPNPYESPRTPHPRAPERLPTRCLTIEELATSNYLLAVFRDEHRQMCQVDPVVDRDASLSFDTTVAQWREACDLLPWRELGRAHNQSWGIDVPDDEWQDALEPASQRQLADVCDLIARHVRRPEIRPTYLLGCTSSAGGAFLIIRSVLQEAGASAREIAPSTPLAPYTRQYCQAFLGPISRLAPGALPLVQIHAPIHDALACGMVCGWMVGLLCLTVGHFGGLPMFTLAGVLLLVASYGLTWIAAWCTWPASVEFGELRTFRDLAVVIAEANATAAGPAPCVRPGWQKRG